MQQNFKNVIRIEHRDALNLLFTKSPIASISGINGWKCDVYNINGVAIVTQYRMLDNIRPYSEILWNYENQAAKILAASVPDFNTRLNNIDQLLNQFIEEVTK